ncbi:unnamed protein product [Mytilus coruscus]|uniref:Uncharacterized protein n=1 Tax=Mytilus coruscus TaxID=42192 RepID=A0A6J8D6H9_MYTCO|nr:unnamed protein product [Mytilus coruscus]
MLILYVEFQYWNLTITCKTRNLSMNTISCNGIDEVGSDIQKISLKNKEIKRKSEGLQLRCKKSKDRSKTLEMELHSEEEKSKRLAFEKHVSEETNRDMNSETAKQLKEFRDLCDIQNSKSISQQNEIDSLKTTNEKLADNLKIVNDELRSHVMYKLKSNICSRKQATWSIGERCFVDVRITDTDTDHQTIYDNLVKMLNIYEIKQENVIFCPFTPNEARIHFYNESAAESLIDKTKQEEKYELKISNTEAAVNIKAKLNISASVFLVESKQRIKNLKLQSGVDVLNEDDGAITLAGDLRSISLALDILLKWTNETSDVKSATAKIGKIGQEKGDLPGSGNQTKSAFLHTWKGDRNHKPNKMRDVERHNTCDPK